MRGLRTAATLILAPTAVLTRPVPDSRVVPTESAFAVAVAVDTSGSRDAKTVDQTLVFNLDIQESSEACNEAKVRIDGYLLSQDDNGTGQGTFASMDGHTVTASWNFTCKEHAKRVPWDQDLAVTIMSLDGEAVPETTFFTSFRQRTPVKVYDVGGDSVIYTTEGRAPSRLDEERLLDRIKTITGLTDVDDEVKRGVREIISLEHQIHELKDLVKTKQRKVLDGLGLMPSTPAFNLQTFYQTAKLASSTLRGTMEHWLDSVLGFPVERKHHRFHHHRYSHPHHPREDGLVVSMQVDGEGGQRFFYYRDDDGSARLVPKRRISYLPLFAIIITFHITLFFVLRSVRQRIHSRHATRNFPNNRRHQRREARAQRRAERRARRGSGFLCSIPDLFQTRRIELNEKTSMLIRDEEENTSMEDELASFQEAASMVSDMVAAEEQRRASRGDETQPPRFTEDVSPPGYDEVQGMHGDKREGC